MLAHSSLDWVFDKLTTGGGQLTAGKTSVWVLDEVKSIEFSFQARVGVSHSFFSHYPSLNWRTRQSSRRHGGGASGGAGGGGNKRGFGFQLD